MFARMRLLGSVQLRSGRRDSMRDERQRRLCFLRDHERGAQRGLAYGYARAIACEDGGDGFASLEPVAGPRGDDEPNGRVRAVADERAAAHVDDAAAQCPRLDARDEATPQRREDLALGRLREDGRIVDDPWIAALRFDDPLKALCGAPRGDRLLE